MINLKKIAVVLFVLMLAIPAITAYAVSRLESNAVEVAVYPRISLEVNSTAVYSGDNILLSANLYNLTDRVVDFYENTVWIGNLTSVDGWANMTYTVPSVAEPTLKAYTAECDSD